LQLNPRTVFLSKNIFSQNILPTLVQKTKKGYALPKLFQCVSATANFDLWMSKGAYDIFSLVVNFLDGNWKPRKVTIDLFETTKTTNQALARNLSEFLDSYNLRKKIIIYVKDEGVNLNAMTMAFKTIINCDILGVEESFNETCFGHVFSKTCQYTTIEEKVCKNLKFISIKSV
jgi:hypothetical protein